MGRTIVSILAAVLLALGGLAAAGCGDDEEPLDPAARRQLEKFDYAIRLSLACRAADLRMAQIPATASPATVARRWQADTHRLSVALLGEKFEPHLQDLAEGMKGPANVLASRLDKLAQTLERGQVRTVDVRPLTEGVADAGRLLRAGARELDSHACIRVDSGAERRLLPSLRRAVQPT